jgi:hypothetical protein
MNAKATETSTRVDQRTSGNSAGDRAARSTPDSDARLNPPVHMTWTSIKRAWDEMKKVEEK